MRVLWISLVIVLVDQATKAVVVRTMHRGESIPVLGDWFKFTFTENPGMAFGLQLFPPQSMALLAIVVTGLLFWYLFSVRGGYTPYVASLALVLGGAVGNVIDRALYGMILGYGDFLQGKVVDFIHVDAWRGYLPEVLPFVGGAYLPLFPIWNVADMSIVVGVVGILVFQRRFHELAFEEPERDRERLRELEREREEAKKAPAAGATQASARSEAPPPRAPSAETTGATLDGEDETAGGAFAPPGEDAPADDGAEGRKSDANADEKRSSVSSEEERA